MIQTIWSKEPDAKSLQPKTPKKISQTQFSQRGDRIQCCYINRTAQFQIVRISSASSDFLERAVLPRTRLLFEADLDDYLEIHTGNPICSILSDKIPCHRLAHRKDHTP
ncbi:DUF1830 domain-containing protein [Nodosilinea sp. LEGE 07088]|uniref:DUF1830 domain-containing protein n=1 Tax=Nodosilinea sp. LEGE 07088 TaxID=2777968 RepID=UPI00187FAB64|nr:DUF1830 domain-containing protein [Nodosilinea sp. LEGE 07088]